MISSAQDFEPHRIKSDTNTSHRLSVLLVTFKLIADKEKHKIAHLFHGQFSTVCFLSALVSYGRLPLLSLLRDLWTTTPYNTSILYRFHGFGKYLCYLYVLVYCKTRNFRMEEILDEDQKNTNLSSGKFVSLHYFGVLYPVSKIWKKFLLWKVQNKKNAKFYGCQYFTLYSIFTTFGNNMSYVYVLYKYIWAAQDSNQTKHTESAVRHIQRDHLGLLPN